MKHFYKLKKYSQIRFVIDNGEKIILQSAICYKVDLAKLNFKIDDAGKCVISFLLSKKFGNAVKRNRARRLIFASLTKSINIINKNYAYTFIPRAKVLNMDFEKLCKEVASCGIAKN